MIFVDTSAWYAALIQDDDNSQPARDWIRHNREEISKSGLLTTDYVVDETLTLLRVRGHKRLALSVGRRVFDGPPHNLVAAVEYVTRLDILRAWEVFCEAPNWSFTDCTSFAVIERLQLKTSFAIDKHFRDFGIVTVVP